MKIEAYTITILVSMLGSSVISALIVWIANRGKTKAEVKNIAAETSNVIAETYGRMFEDLKDQIKYQGDQIKALQQRELEYLKIIHGHQETERELRAQIKALEIKLSLRITKIETDNQ